jgi:hypothetical protein
LDKNPTGKRSHQEQIASGKSWINCLFFHKIIFIGERLVAIFGKPLMVRSPFPLQATDMGNKACSVSPGVL